MESPTCRVASSFCLIAALLASGCGSGLCPVEGTVTYRGQPLEQGRIGFYPQDGRPAYGEIKQGQYRLFTREPGDGAAPGRYRVTVASDRPSDPNDAFSDRISLIPERYAKPETSGLEVEVKPGVDRYDFSLTD